MLALAIALTLVPPVPGTGRARRSTYAGDPFARGHHRGADLAARPGEPVRAACGGRVAFAGRAGANGRAVTIRCGPWSVTHLPLRELAVRAGERVLPGATIGTAAASREHAGIHLGVRRTSDPAATSTRHRLLRAPRRPAPPAGPRSDRETARPGTTPPSAVAVAARTGSAAPPVPRSRVRVHSPPGPPGPGSRCCSPAPPARAPCAGAGPAAPRPRAPRRRLYGEPMSVLLVGFGLGFFVAAQLGPLSLFAIRSTLRSGASIGLAIGAGVAVIDTLYAAAGAAGAAGLLEIEPLRVAFGLIGAAVLVLLGVRTLVSAFRVRLGGEVDEEVATPGRAFATALGATASNPLTIASWAAIFTAAGAAGAAEGAGVAVLLAGVGLGSMTWMAILATGVSVARRWVGDRTLRAVDGLAGLGLLGFGGLLAVRTRRLTGR